MKPKSHPHKYKVLQSSFSDVSKTGSNHGPCSLNSLSNILLVSRSLDLKVTQLLIDKSNVLANQNLYYIQIKSVTV